MTDEEGLVVGRCGAVALGSTDTKYSQSDVQFQMRNQNSITSLLNYLF